MDIQDSIQALKLPENRDMIHRSPNVLIDGSTTKACMGGISEESINITAKKMKNGTLQTWLVSLSHKESSMEIPPSILSLSQLGT